MTWANQPVVTTPLTEEVLARFATPKGHHVSGPVQAPFIGRNKPHRSDQKWVNGWSPGQISNRLQTDFQGDESMRISHEAICQALYIHG